MTRSRSWRPRGSRLSWDGCRVYSAPPPRNTGAYSWLFSVRRCWHRTSARWFPDAASAILWLPCLMGARSQFVDWSDKTLVPREVTMETLGERSWTGFVVVVVVGFGIAVYFGYSTIPVAHEPRGSVDEAATAEPLDQEEAAANEMTKDELDAVLLTRLAELQGEIDTIEEQARTYEEQLFGPALAWPKQVPHELSSSGFRDQVEIALGECDPDVDLLGIDCSEPPCLALLRIRSEDWRAKMVTECAPWSEPFGTQTSGISFSVTCADGSGERAEMIGAPLRKVLGETADEQAEAMSRRLQARMLEPQLHWVCAGEEK